MRMKKRIITQERILLLQRYLRKNGKLPSFRELGVLLGFKSPNASARFYRAIEQAGYIRRDGTKLISTSLLAGFKCYSSISAGFPSPAEDELCDVISLEEYLIGNNESVFLVKVSGDSMIGAGIMPGDIIIVNRGADPISNDIVVAEVDGEWTLKYFIRTKHGVILRAANDSYPDILPKNELRIGGVVTGVVRRYYGGTRES
ncbi:MAG: LexA family transcriptional repressor [Candidatus Hydrogenedentes bacterium CG07_land_8_20_14_0_80_42_17]|nr:MAG: LexA family transcriptional repressor [Candidatus Hydrogenedentes bacterium CG07_land_8_20_14_0_80_42_17]